MKNILTMVLVMCAMLSFAQKQVVTGKVLSKTTNSPLQGATVTAGNTTSVTDENGAFSISADGSGTIKVTHVGMLPIELKLDGKNDVIINMDPANDLDEIVITGYKAERKKDLTGAVAVVNMAEIKNIPASNPLLAIQGRVPGLYIESDGSPNGGNRRVLIRGLNNLGNSDPLYIIDGVPTKGPQVFASLNPGSIASVQVLKDASAASIYGARASNGVIIVTTKAGQTSQETKTNIQFNSSITAQSANPSFEDVLSAEDRGRILWRAAVNDNTDPSVHSAIYTYDWNGDYQHPVLNKINIQPYVNGDVNEPAANTNWQKALYKTGIISQNDLTLTHGNNRSGLMINFGYYKNSGTMVYTGLERISTRINAYTSFLNNRIKIGENLLLSRTNQRLQSNDIGGAPTPILGIILLPTIPVYKTDGTFAGPAGAGYSDRNNPVNMQYVNRFDKNILMNLFGNLYLEATLLKNLVFRTSYGGDFNLNRTRDVQLAFQEGFLGRNINSLALQETQNLSSTWTNTLNYVVNIGEHRIDLLGGAEAIQFDNQTFGAFRESFATQEDNYFFLNSGIGRSTNNGTETGYRLFSQFGKAFYSYKDKYLASFTLRRDGSSRFGSNNAYGLFPAATIGWRISDETFFTDVNAVSELKLRVGVGKVGNQEIGDLARFGLLRSNYGTIGTGFPGSWTNIGSAYDLNGENGGTLPSGYVQVQAANPNLKWESTTETNVGVDFSLFNRSITGSFDYFVRKTEDILIQPPIASAIGEGRLRWLNGATKSNKGWELLLGYQKTVGNFYYSITGNAARFRDKITDLPAEVRTAYPGNVEKTIIGHSQLSFFGYKTDGIFQTEEEVNNHATQVGAGVGRIRYKDLNNDGEINALDQDWLGTTLPALEYGLKLDFGYKNLDVSVFGSGVAGKQGFDRMRTFNSFVSGGENNGPGLLNAWTPENPGASVPKLSLGNSNNEGRTSDYTIVNASYFRLRNIQIGYTIAPNTLQKRGIQSLRFYLIGQNLFLLKSKEFFSKDPERVGGDQYWPQPTSATFGINLNL